MSEERDRDDALRGMAQHRGFKLLKSRRRKAGVGDFGRFGLSDAAGKPVMGVGPDGLTALPDEIEAFLREGALDGWKASAKANSSLPKKAKVPNAVEGTSTQAVRSSNAPTRRKARDTSDRTMAKADPISSSRRMRAGGNASQKRLSMAAKKAQPRPAPPEPVPPAPLLLRKPTKNDAGDLVTLGELPGIDRTAQDITRDLATTRKAGGGMLLAERGGLVGCIGWAIVPTIHRGPIGRITVLVVSSKERRRGVGRKLVDGALAALAAAGCATAEAMSDIDIRNAHNFFRSLEFAQASYRFTRLTVPSGT